MTTRPVYLDHHATTPCAPEVLAAMLPWFTEKFGNAASINHLYGTEARAAVEAAREQVAALIHASSRGLIFTSGATEANNLAIKGRVLPLLRTASSPPHIITNAAEHRSVLDCFDRLKRQGARVTILPVDETGRVSPDEVAAAIGPDTVLVSVLMASNEIGTINPIREIAAVCRAHPQVVFHVDAVQAAGRIPVDFEELGADLLSLTAHKLYGPKGVGALVMRRGGRRIALEPLLDGGGHEQHLRSGTLPVPLIVGFGEACRLAATLLREESERLRTLRDQLWRELSSRLTGLFRNGHPVECLPGNLNVSVADVDGEALMTAMTRIAVSSGSACTSSNPEPSHVLRAIGRSDILTRASLRFGLGRSTSPADIDLAVECVVEAVQHLRRCPSRGSA